ncbi:MAG: hypothetical protein ACLPXT_03070 [Terracidiphilus sp.]
MTEAIQIIPAPSEVNEPIAASANPAIARCLNAWARVNKAERAKGKSKSEASSEADHAYCDAMPPLSGSDNISDFIACVAHAMTAQIISPFMSTKLLYAAQVAYSAARCQSASIKTAA